MKVEYNLSFKKSRRAKTTFSSNLCINSKKRELYVMISLFSEERNYKRNCNIIR